MILGLVGAEAAKFTPLGERRARRLIRDLYDEYQPEDIASGRCHLGGIDVWAEEEWQANVIAGSTFEAQHIYPSTTLRWGGPGGFEERNFKIARAGDVLVCIAVDCYPEEFASTKYDRCYHCHKPRNARRWTTPIPGHVKSGGCWTMYMAAEMGKRWRLEVVCNT